MTGDDCRQPATMTHKAKCSLNNREVLQNTPNRIFFHLPSKKVKDFGRLTGLYK
jgi:hypothetical protein